MFKKLSLVLLAVFQTSFLFGQITITQNDLIVIGESITRSTDSLAAGVSIGSPGANQTWDFTNIIAHTTATTIAVNPPNQGNFPNSNMALTIDNSNYVYVQSQPTFFNIEGIVLNINGTIFNAPLNPPFKQYQFPSQYGDVYTDNYIVDITFDGSAISPLVDEIRYKSVGTVMDTIDAYGSVTTSYGTYQTIRKKQIVQTIDSVWTKGFFPPIWTLFDASRDTTVTYYWLTEDMKLPTVEIQLDSLGNPGSVVVSFQPPPLQADFDFVLACAGGAVQFTDLTEGFPDGWFWEFGDLGNTSTNQNPQYTFQNPGDYDITLTASRGGDDTSSITKTITVENCVSAGDINTLSQGISIYPNPARDHLFLNVDAIESELVHFNIYNITGQILHNGSLTPTFIKELNISDFPEGIYFVELLNNHGEVLERRKIVIQ